MKLKQKEKQINNLKECEYHQPESIEQLLEQDNTQNEYKITQRKIILNKINICMMYYLMTECKLYQFEGKHPQKSNHFIYIDKITKENEVVYDINKVDEVTKEMCYEQMNLHRRKLQLEKMSTLIEKEKGIKFQFNDKINYLQLINVLDKNGNKMDLKEFVEKYDQYEKLLSFLKNTNSNEDEILSKINNIPNNNNINNLTNNNNNTKTAAISQLYFTENKENKSIETKELQNTSGEIINEISEKIDLKWEYHDSDAIERILSQENALNKTKNSQRGIILRKLNSCMIYYLMTECRGYEFKMKPQHSSKYFTYIEKILKNNQIIFEMTEIDQQLTKGMNHSNMNIQRRKYQMKKLSEFIENESGMKFTFNDNVYDFQIIKLIDKDGSLIDLIEFIEKYEQYDYLIKLLNSEGMNEEEKIKRKEQTEQKWEYYQPEIIEQLLFQENGIDKGKEAQLLLILRKINISMIYYLLTECKGYKFKMSNISSKHFIYIETIHKMNRIIYNANKLNDESMKGMNTTSIKLLQRKYQFEKLSELIENESGMKFIFNGNSDNYQIINVIDKNDKPIDLIQFIQKYEQYNKLVNLLKSNNIEKEENVWKYHDPDIIYQFLRKENALNLSKHD